MTLESNIKAHPFGWFFGGIGALAISGLIGFGAGNINGQKVIGNYGSNAVVRVKPIGDMNGDNVPDLLVETPNRKFLAYGTRGPDGKPNGEYIGYPVIASQYKNADDQVNGSGSKIVK